MDYALARTEYDRGYNDGQKDYFDGLPTARDIRITSPSDKYWGGYFTGYSTGRVVDAILREKE